MCILTAPCLFTAAVKCHYKCQLHIQNKNEPTQWIILEERTMHGLNMFEETEQGAEIYNELSTTFIFHMISFDYWHCQTIRLIKVKFCLKVFDLICV